jgi:hypothetical protein
MNNEFICLGCNKIVACELTDLDDIANNREEQMCQPCKDNINNRTNGVKPRI